LNIESFFFLPLPEPDVDDGDDEEELVLSLSLRLCSDPLAFRLGAEPKPRLPSLAWALDFLLLAGVEGSDVSLPLVAAAGAGGEVAPVVVAFEGVAGGKLVAGTVDAGAGATSFSLAAGAVSGGGAISFLSSTETGASVDVAAAAGVASFALSSLSTFAASGKGEVGGRGKWVEGSSTVATSVLASTFGTVGVDAASTDAVKASGAIGEATGEGIFSSLGTVLFSLSLTGKIGTGMSGAVFARAGTSICVDGWSTACACSSFSFSDVVAGLASADPLAMAEPSTIPSPLGKVLLSGSVLLSFRIKVGTGTSGAVVGIVGCSEEIGVSTEGALGTADGRAEDAAAESTDVGGSGIMSLRDTAVLGVGMAICSELIGSTPTTLLIAAPKPLLTYWYAETVPSLATIVFAKSDRDSRGEGVLFFVPSTADLASPLDVVGAACPLPSTSPTLVEVSNPPTTTGVVGGLTFSGGGAGGAW